MNQLLIYILALIMVISHAVMWVLYFRHEVSIFRKAKPTGFFGKESWKRKYKERQGILKKKEGKELQLADENSWYYDFFNIKYKEAFPGSATVFVFITDGYHFVQFIMWTCLAVIITLSIDGGLWNFIMVRIPISLTFEILFSRILTPYDNDL